MRPRGVGVLLTGQHAGELANTLVPRDQSHVRLGDHIDPVGGRAAIEVGRRLSELAQGSQVLVVTHLAQVAAFADHHLVVTKSTADGVDVVTESDVRLVTLDQRVRELARMLSGQEDSDAARTHAAELLELSSVGR